MVSCGGGGGVSSASYVNFAFTFFKIFFEFFVFTAFSNQDSFQDNAGARKGTQVHGLTKFRAQSFKRSHPTNDYF